MPEARGPWPESTWEIGEIPLHVGVRKTPSNDPLPDTMPMRVGVDQNSGALVQIPDPDVMAALDRAYAASSQIGTPLSAAGLGRPALDDVLSFVREAIGEHALVGATVLEIGCGSGALLARLAQAGASVLGVEPGAQAAERARADGLEVIARPFTQELFPDRRFDLILHHAVLEHVSAPVEFLRDQLAVLADDGIIVCSVPDCSQPLAEGDLSMLVHEHLSYFTPATLHLTGARAGGRPVTARASLASGAIYCAWTAGGTADTSAVAPHVPADRFIEGAPRSLDAVQTFCRRIAADGRTLGIFCPSRFMNYQALTTVLPSLRYFDDDPLLEGLYYPPFDVPVESRDSLLSRPVDELLVMSWTFGQQIADSLRAQPQAARTTIYTVSDLLGASGRTDDDVA